MDESGPSAIFYTTALVRDYQWLSVAFQQADTEMSQVIHDL